MRFAWGLAWTIAVALCTSSVGAQTPAAEQPATQPEGTEAVVATDDPYPDVPSVQEIATDAETTAPVETPAPEQPPAPPATDGALAPGIPIRFQLNGYFRARLALGNGWAGPREGFTATLDPAHNPAFGFMRARLEPAITYGSDPAAPVAAFRMQLDLLDNVVFGDNARQAGTPLFAENPSSTDIDGNDVLPIRIRRAWLEFNIPVGQIRIGRQASHGGMGILFNDGNGFRNEWGDSQYGTTFDRVLFATRPLTIINALTRGDTRPTPLIFAVAHDWLVEDPLGLGRDPALDSLRQPIRSQIPFASLGNSKDDVGEAVFVLAWQQPNINPLRPTDELNAGFIGVYRYQDQTSSRIAILDWFWKLRYSFWGRNNPALFTNGEVYTIQGTSHALPLGMSFDNETGRTPEASRANIWGAVVQAGAADDNWEAKAEWGYSGGDDDIFSGTGSHTFTQRANAADYRVGLLMYPVALNARTANAYGPTVRSLWSRGGVWNSMYFFPQIKYRIFNGVEAQGAFLLAWADVINEAYGNTVLARQSSGNNSLQCKPFQADCFLGWELDVGLNVTWGDNDIMRWRTEFGLMKAGGALAAELDQDLMWTLQTRVAMVF